LRHLNNAGKLNDLLIANSIYYGKVFAAHKPRNFAIFILSGYCVEQHFRSPSFGYNAKSSGDCDVTLVGIPPARENTIPGLTPWIVNMIDVDSIYLTEKIEDDRFFQKSGKRHH
jgi:hypothetical protein